LFAHLSHRKGTASGAHIFLVLRLIVLILGLVAVAFACYGIGSGGRFYFAVAKDPFRHFETGHWFHESILHTGLAYALGFNNSHLSFSLFVLAFSPLTLLYLGIQVARRLSETWAYLFLLLLTFHPVTLIHYTWVLHPDALVALFTAVVFFSYAPVVIFIACTLGALAHASQFLVVLLLCFLIRMTFESAAMSPMKLAAAASLGWLLGKTLVWLYLRHFDIDIASTRLTIFIDPESHRRVQQFLLNPWTTLYTLYAGYWVLAVAVGYALRQLSRKHFWVFLLSQVIAGAVTFLTADTTRVFATLTWAPLTFCAIYVLVHVHRLTPRQGQVFKGIVVGSLVLGMVCPKLYSFSGIIWTMDETRGYLQQVLRDAGVAR